MAVKMKEVEGGVCAASGFKVNAEYCGLRKAEKDDLTLLFSELPASSAGCLTRNHVQAWCVQHNRERLKHGNARAIVCFAGNANACNGQGGKSADIDLAALTAKELQVSPEEVLTASTGVIGRPVAYEKLERTLPTVVKGLGKNSAKASAAIMTTDLVPKSIAVSVEVEGKTFSVGGMAKGSGMIAPNMATMLGFVTTDLALSPELLQLSLNLAVKKSFNRITVDGDTSTNDMVLILANGASSIDGAKHMDAFQEALNLVCERLAKMIARDGEGATKMVEVRIRNGQDESVSERIAKTIAESPLVKTACFGNDPNWGRVLAAAGRAGVPFNSNDVAISIAGIEVFRGGEPTSYEANRVSAAMKSDPLLIDVLFLHPKEQHAPVSVWTCDFSYDYVKINADYGT